LAGVQDKREEAEHEHLPGAAGASGPWRCELRRRGAPLGRVSTASGHAKVADVRDFDGLPIVFFHLRAAYSYFGLGEPYVLRCRECRRSCSDSSVGAISAFPHSADLTAGRANTNGSADNSGGEATGSCHAPDWSCYGPDFAEICCFRGCPVGHL